MEDGSSGVEGSTSAGRFPILQANRDPESNWEVDVAKSLEEYLLKICSGEISGEDGAYNFNFAEAALLLQGSVQVYSRKVEYLYSLVLHALEFLSQNKQDQQEKGSAETNENDPSTSANKEDDIFVGLDDVPAESRTTLDNNLDRDDLRKKIVRPPANLLVFEGDGVDSEASELDSYLLATCGFYGDFLLLDPRDAPAVFDFLQGKISGKEDFLAHRGGSAPSKIRNNVFASPNVRSGGTARKRTPGKVQEPLDIGIEKSQESQDHSQGSDVYGGDWSDHPVEPDIPGASMPEPDDTDPGCPDPGDDSDDEDPYRSLDPHEPSNLKIKPYKRVKGFARKVIGTPKKKTLASIFHVAMIDGPTKSFEVHMSWQENSSASQSVPLYEKLRMSFETGKESCGDSNDDNQPNIDIHDSDSCDETDMLNYDMEIDSPTYSAKNVDVQPTQESQDGKRQDKESLADLCDSHLKQLLDRIAEAEQQTELDARVSTWKERIEHALEQQVWLKECGMSC
uniref:Uncharacterized protein n=1 Tax=Avena sativa TaxID=4498 RepID=A0ACD5Y136_AVESA